MRAHLVCGWMATAHLYGSLAARVARRPSLWYQLGIPAANSWLDRAATLLPSCGVVTCSRAGAQAQTRLRPRRPTRVVYPGVEIGRFDPASLPSPREARRRLGLPETGPLIGIVGRLQRWKGMHVLVEAMPRVLRSYPNASCVLVGGAHAQEPDYPRVLGRSIAERGLGDRVLLTGLQPNVPEWMQAMDVVVHASDREPFGIVILEAMALGKPVVAGDAGGPREIVTEGETGLLTPYGNAEALASAILRYLDDPAFARQVGSAAREHARTFSTECYARSFLAATRELMEKPCPLGSQVW
jgi:glycosyltransferase involved in cell wall biosynthesis